jgi:hypothetical protein
MHKTRFAMDHVHLSPLTPIAFVAFLDLAIRQAVPPTDHQPTALALGRVPTTAHCQQSRRVAGLGIGKYRWHMPLTKTAFGILDESQRLLLGAFAHDERHHQLAVSGYSRTVPQIASVPSLMIRTAFLLFLTTLHCSSHSKARGRRACTC